MEMTAARAAAVEPMRAGPAAALTGGGAAVHASGSMSRDPRPWYRGASRIAWKQNLKAVYYPMTICIKPLLSDSAT